ncbi:MAG: DUF308 domain-containing protein [Microbacterium sp.]
MSSAPAAARITSRHVQLVRALIAAAAAAMITFSPDHSHTVGLTVFSGFAMASALALILAAVFVDDRTRRASLIALGVIDALAAVAASLQPLRSTLLLFVLIIAWALLSGAVELAAGIADRRAGRERSLVRDEIFVGALGVLLAVAVAVVPPQYSLDYFIEEAGRSFTLSGEIIIVGLIGGYAAILAVYLGIAGLSPRTAADDASDAPEIEEIPGAAASSDDAVPTRTTHPKDPA